MSVIKYIQEIGWKGVDWIHMAQDRHKWRSLMNNVINLWVPYIVGNLVTNYATAGFSRRTLLR